MIAERQKALDLIKSASDEQITLIYPVMQELLTFTVKAYPTSGKTSKKDAFANLKKIIEKIPPSIDDIDFEKERMEYLEEKYGSVD